MLWPRSHLSLFRHSHVMALLHLSLLLYLYVCAFHLINITSSSFLASQRPSYLVVNYEEWDSYCKSFIEINLPLTKGTVRHNITMTVNQFQYPRQKEVKHHEESQGMIKTKVDMPWCILSCFWKDVRERDA